MKLPQVAAQLYTVRDHCQTVSDLAASLKKIRAIGYPAVQVSAIGPIPEDELVKLLAGEGLVCCATHEPGEKILNDPPAVVARLKKLGCRYTAYPYPANVNFDTLAGIHDLAGKLNAAGKVLNDAGLVLGYHNHSLEFRRVEGRLVLEEIYARTDPRFVQGEIDTYWVQHGGGDPVDWCRRLKNRLPLIHLKDYVADAKSQPTYCAVGAGNLNWPEIIRAADAAGCQWYIVEQDTAHGDPFDELQRSFDYIAERLCSPSGTTVPVVAAWDGHAGRASHGAPGRGGDAAPTRG